MGHSIRVISVVVVVLIFYMRLGSGSQGKEIIFIDDDDSRSEDGGCKILNDHRGECVDIRKCPILLALIGKPDRHEFLRQASCGWNHTIPMVCCDTSWNCTTSDNEPGQCIKFTSCPDIFARVINFTVSVEESFKYLQNHRCGSKQLDVCCTSLPSKFDDQVHVTTTTAKSMDITNCEMRSLPPDQLSYCCGQEVSANRIIGGEATSIDQYPWAAAIEYAREGVIRIKCGGTLISATYVVTAAHCLFNTAWTPLNVRLGDYDIDNPGVDCVEVEGGGEDCTDEPVVITIAKNIPHPDYNPSSRGQTNDIALLKLQDSAPYTDFIRPICLPTSDFTKTTAAKIELNVAGWGASDVTRSYSPIKLHVALPFVSRENCFDAYRRLNISLGEGQICAGGEIGKDSCKGDSGGALMLIKEKMTEIVGITSFGFTPCGLENKPGVYTKIYKYLPWIKSIIS